MEAAADAVAAAVMDAEAVAAADGAADASGAAADAALIHRDRSGNVDVNLASMTAAIIAKATEAAACQYHAENRARGGGAGCWSRSAAGCARAVSRAGLRGISGSITS